MMMLRPSGDSTTQKQEPIRRLLTSTKCGDQVDISDTRDYTSMQLNLNPLEYAYIPRVDDYVKWRG